MSIHPATKDLILSEAKRLHEIGLACHWLGARSKIPVAKAWSTKGREPWGEIAGGYHKGYNVGTRLGRASMLGTHYLAVIDCDCKSTDPRHRAEMEACVGLHFPDLPLDTPRVLTGRGNGSAHIYVVSEKPAVHKRVSQSPETVKVKMPSAEKPSRRELTELTAEEIGAHIRLRPAWEVSVMGEAQQVVLPPSVHPDTGKRYEWAFPLVEGDQIPVVDLEERGDGDTSHLQASGVHRPELARNGDFQPLQIDLVGSTLPDDLVDMILSGKGVGDRSEALFSAANQLVKAGWSDDQILTVLTDPDTYLGAAAFDHARTRSRAKAANWVFKYTLAKSRESNDATKAFTAAVEVVDPTELSEEDQAQQELELFGGEHWKERLERSGEKGGFRPIPSLKNVLLILAGEYGKTLFQKNDFSGYQLHGVTTPWAKTGAEVTDEHVACILKWLTTRWRFEPSIDKIHLAITVLARENAFHPVRDYLKALRWDGTPRIDTWMRDYLQATAPEPYLSAVSAKMLVAMVKRVYEPGSKYDQVVILEGKQGKGKSTVLQRLAGPEWFTDAPLNITDKDAVLGMRGAWLVELGELAGMRRADVNALKEFISRQVDRIRAPYGRRVEAFPRQCIFVGTTNLDEYLRDPTGNRRYWPVRVGKCDFDAVSEARDQLFAEAVGAYELGETLYLASANAEEQALTEQADRNESDTWEERLGDFFAAEAAKREAGGESTFNPARFTLTQLFADDGPFKHYRDSSAEQRRLGHVLRTMGYHKSIERFRGKKSHVWLKPIVKPIVKPIGDGERMGNGDGEQV